MLLTQILPVVQAFKWKMFNPDPSKKSVKRKAKRYVFLLNVTMKITLHQSKQSLMTIWYQPETFRINEQIDSKINKWNEIKMNCFCGVIDQRKALNLTQGQEHCQRFSRLQIIDSLLAEFDPAQNLIEDIDDLLYAAVITTTPQRHIIDVMKRLYLTLLRKSFLTICKYFVRSNLDYSCIRYEKPFRLTNLSEEKLKQFSDYWWDNGGLLVR